MGETGNSKLEIGEARAETRGRGGEKLMMANKCQERFRQARGGGGLGGLLLPNCGVASSVGFRPVIRMGGEVIEGGGSTEEHS